MRLLIALVLLVALLLGGVIVYLVVTTPRDSVQLRFPLSAADRDLLAVVPSSADAFALVPSAVTLHRQLSRNPVTRDVVASWSAEHELPKPWMLGTAAIVLWNDGGRTSYAIRLDPFRAFVLRSWLSVASNADARWQGSTLIMNSPNAAPPAEQLDSILSLTDGFPPSDALIVQREGERGAFPPIGRPSVTAAQISASEVTMISRAATSDRATAEEIRGRHASGAMLSLAFTQPPRALSDLNRLLGARLDEVIGEGATLVLYDVDSGTFLPRPMGVVAVPADPRRRDALERLGRLVDLVGDTGETRDELFVAFGRSSQQRYEAQLFEPARWSANRWTLRLEPELLAPVLRAAGDSTGLRIAAPRLHRGARDLRRWLGAIERADSVEAASSVADGFEELKVRVTAK